MIEFWEAIIGIALVGVGLYFVGCSGGNCGSVYDLELGYLGLGGGEGERGRGLACERSRFRSLRCRRG